MPDVGSGLDRKMFSLKKYSFTVDGDGDYAGTETWPNPFVQIPVTAVIPPLGFSNISITSVTTTGFTWSVSSQTASTTIEVGVMAHEKL